MTIRWYSWPQGHECITFRYGSYIHIMKVDWDIAIKLTKMFLKGYALTWWKQMHGNCGRSLKLVWKMSLSWIIQMNVKVQHLWPCVEWSQWQFMLPLYQGIYWKKLCMMHANNKICEEIQSTKCYKMCFTF